MGQSVSADSFALSLGSVLVKFVSFFEEGFSCLFSIRLEFLSFFLGASSSITDPSVRSETLSEIEPRCAKNWLQIWPCS